MIIIKPKKFNVVVVLLQCEREIFMSYIIDTIESKKIKNAKKHYQGAIEYLSGYDSDSLNKLKGHKPQYAITVDECIRVIEMVTGKECGEEKIYRLREGIGSIYKSFLGEEVYPSVEEKAVNLLYLLLQKNGVLEGDREHAAILFLYFLDKNGLLYENGEKRLSDKTLVLMTILMSCVKTENKNKMVTLLTNFLCTV